MKKKNSRTLCRRKAWVWGHPRTGTDGQHMEHFYDITMKSDLGYESTVSKYIAINMYNRAKANEVVTSKCLCLPLIRKWERFYEAC